MIILTPEEVDDLRFALVKAKLGGSAEPLFKLLDTVLDGDREVTPVVDVYSSITFETGGEG